MKNKAHGILSIVVAGGEHVIPDAAEAIKISALKDEEEQANELS